MLRRAGRCKLDEGSTGRSADGPRSRAEEVLEQILASKDGRALASMSQTTYSDQPILRTGADFARERAMRRQEGRNAARSAREQRVERRHQQVSFPAPARGASSTPESAQSAWPSFSFVAPSFFNEESAELLDSELPPRLQELRHLEKVGLRPG